MMHFRESSPFSTTARRAWEVDDFSDGSLIMVEVGALCLETEAGLPG